MTRIIIKSRFNGPPDSGNGGYVCGVVASALEGPSIVTLRKPPPLERELILETLDERHAVLRDGETVVGETMAQKWPGTTATSIRLPVQDGSITSSFVFRETVGVNVTVVGADEPFGETAPIEGAEVCQDGTDNCAITNVDGEATLQIPGNDRRLADSRWLRALSGSGFCTLRTELGDLAVATVEEDEVAGLQDGIGTGRAFIAPIRSLQAEDQ